MLSLSGGYRSGQTGQTVNLLAHAFAGSNPAPPNFFPSFPHRPLPPLPVPPHIRYQSFMATVMKDKWIQLALRLAEATAPTSTDRYHKVGCAILRKEGSVCGIGFNGQPPGVDLTDDEALHRDFRRRLTTHAESNALAFCQPGEPYLLAVTLPPCDRCLVDAVRYGVKIIVCRPSPEPDTHPVPHELAKRLNVEIRVIERD